MNLWPVEQQTSQKVRIKVFNWSKVHLYRSNFLQNPYFSEKMIISYSCIRGFMPNLDKKSWTLSNLQSCLTHVRLAWDERLRLAETSDEDIESKLNLISIVNKKWFQKRKVEQKFWGRCGSIVTLRCLSVDIYQLICQASTFFTHFNGLF